MSGGIRLTLVGSYVKVHQVLSVSSKGICLAFEILFNRLVLNCPFSDNCSAPPKRKTGNILKKINVVSSALCTNVSSFPSPSAFVYSYNRKKYFCFGDIFFSPCIFVCYVTTSIMRNWSGRGNCRSKTGVAFVPVKPSLIPSFFSTFKQNRFQFLFHF